MSFPKKDYKINGATTLAESPSLERLQENLRDLIIIALERSTRTHGNSYSLTKLEYVSGGKQEGKCFMLFDVLVKDLRLNENTTVRVTVAVETDLEKWTR